MCGRYALESKTDLLACSFGLELHQLSTIASTWNAAPQSFQPVIRLNPLTGKREAPLLRWGLVPFWARQQHRGLNTINARAEEAATKPAFREALKRRRCLVPADAYYEWQHKSAKLKQPFAIARVNREPMAFAGLWESWLQPNGRALETFAILTIAANAKLSALHDRMPVLVEPCDYTRWLSTEVHQAPTELLRPADENTLQAWPVSARVGNIRNNDRSLLDAVDEPEQARQQSLFD